MKSRQNQVVMQQNLKKNQMRCTILWNGLALPEWEIRFNTIKRANLLQSYDYVHAMARLNNQRPRYGLIMIDGNEAGLVSILEAGVLKNALHGVILDCGPLWFDGYGSIEDFSVFMDAFTAQFPKRFGRRLRVTSGYKNSVEAQDIMATHGFKTTDAYGYKTIWLDLRESEETLRKNLNRKWRNSLSKAERQNLEIIWSDDGQYFGWLLEHYARDKAAKNYDNVSIKTFMKLAVQFSSGKNLLQGTALFDGQPIAAIVCLNHGLASTYQIGYASDIGRAKWAHHMLLWDAIAQMKERNIYNFDLGGINEEGAKTIGKFKSGMGGEEVEMLGLYC